MEHNNYPETIFWKENFFKKGIISPDNNINEGFNVKYLDEDTISIKCINRLSSEITLSAEDALSLCNEMALTLSDILKFNKIELNRKEKEKKLFKALKNDEIQTVYLYKLCEAPGLYKPEFTEISGLYVYRIFVKPKNISKNNKIDENHLLCYDTIFSNKTLINFKVDLETNYKVNVDFCKDQDYIRPALNLEEIKNKHNIKLIKYTNNLFRLILSIDNNTNIIDNLYKCDIFEFSKMKYHLDKTNTIYMYIDCDDPKRLKYLNSKNSNK